MDSVACEEPSADGMTTKTVAVSYRLSPPNFIRRAFIASVVRLLRRRRDQLVWPSGRLQKTCIVVVKVPHAGICDSFGGSFDEADGGLCVGRCGTQL